MTVFTATDVFNNDITLKGCVIEHVPRAQVYLLVIRRNRARRMSKNSLSAISVFW